MRILFVSSNTDPLAPPVNGDAQRTHMLYEACQRFAEVDVISFAGQPERVPSRGKLKKWLALLPFGSVTALFPVDPQREAVIDDAVRKGNYDFIVARYFYRAVSCGLWKYRDKLVVDFDDALPFFFLSQVAPDTVLTRRIRLKLSARKAQHIARRVVRKLHAAFFAEETVAASNRGVFLPNIPFHPEPCPDADMTAAVKRILFVGQLEYQPNKEGMNHFLDHVYMPLRERLPKVELHLVGLIQDEALRQRWQSFPEVTVTGFVDDLRREYEQSHVVVVPIYQCGATNIKLLEALAMNRACVTTSEAFAKMNDCFKEGRDLLVASNDESFVDLLVTMLTDGQENRRIAHQGKAVMDQYYLLDAFCKIVESAIV